MVGLFEPVCAPWKVGGRARGLLLRRDHARLGSHGPVRREGDERACRSRSRPASRKFFCGPESFTPDLQPVVGEAPELKNYFVAAGLNSIGILTGGGLGRVMAHWIINGRARRRRHRLQHRSPAHLPGEPRVPAHAHRRVARHGLPVPLPDALDADRARREEVGDPRSARRARRLLQGRERLGRRRLVRAARAWSPRSDALSWGRQNWFPYWEAEHEATREGVILMDMSFMAKFLVQGRDAGRILNHISANNVDGAPGHDHLHAVAQRGRHARGRPHGHQARRRALLGRRVRHRAPPRRDLDAPAHPRRRARLRHRRDLGLRADQRAGAALARAAAVAHERRSLERGVPVPHRARDRHRLRARAVRAHHLPRRARLRALHPRRAGDARLRPPRRGGRSVRPAPRGPEGAREPAHGEGLPRLRPRHRQHRLGARGRARLRGRPRRSRAASSGATRCWRRRRRARSRGASCRSW